MPRLSLTSYLLGDKGCAEVGSILRRHFDLSTADSAFVQRFTDSLARSQNHSETPEFFREQLRRPELQKRLETFVIEEFVVSTNYLALQAGQESRLQMLVV